MLKKTLSLVLLLILFAQYSLAQYNNPRGRVPKNLLGLSVGGKIGATMYFGDLVDGGRAKWTVGGYVEKAALSWLCWRVEVEAGACKGAQGDALEFSTTFADIDALAKVHFLDLIQGYDDARPFSPYFALGGGAMFFKCKKNPQSGFDVEAYKEKVGNDEAADKWLNYDEGMKPTGLATGLLGVRYAVNSKLWITFEAKGDLLFTDEFDGHTGWPANADTWIESDGKYDALWTMAFGVQYRFYNVSKFTSSSKYSRKSYLRNRKIYEKNAKRMRRR